MKISLKTVTTDQGRLRASLSQPRPQGPPREKLPTKESFVGQRGGPWGRGWASHRCRVDFSCDHQWLWPILYDCLWATFYHGLWTTLYDCPWLWHMLSLSMIHSVRHLCLWHILYDRLWTTLYDLLRRSINKEPGDITIKQWAQIKRWATL